MKFKIILTLISVALLISCKKTSTRTLDEMVDPVSTLIFSGTFASTGGENVSGIAKIYVTANKYSLKLENFSSSNGPDLKVYLSLASTPTGFISLGDLKSTNGNQVYEINASPDFSKYKYVLIHCEKYNHLFGVAELFK